MSTTSSNQRSGTAFSKPVNSGLIAVRPQTHRMDIRFTMWTSHLLATLEQIFKLGDKLENQFWDSAMRPQMQAIEWVDGVLSAHEQCAWKECLALECESKKFEKNFSALVYLHTPAHMYADFFCAFSSEHRDSKRILLSGHTLCARRSCTSYHHNLDVWSKILMTNHRFTLSLWPMAVRRECLVVQRF